MGGTGGPYSGSALARFVRVGAVATGITTGSSSAGCGVWCVGVGCSFTSSSSSSDDAFFCSSSSSGNHHHHHHRHLFGFSYGGGVFVGMERVVASR